MSRITICKLIAALVVVSAILAPSAGAQPIDLQRDSLVPVAHGKTQTGGQFDSSDFDWGDATVGAAGMLIVLSAGAAGVVTIRRSRGRGQTLATR